MTPTLPFREVLSWTTKLLFASGVPEPQAENAAEVFTLASLRGLGHHDLSYLPQRLGWLRDKLVNPQPDLRLVSQTGGTEVWEGDGGLGEVVCHHVTHRALSLARSQGVGYAVVRNSNHFLAASPYASIGAREGALVVVWSNTDAGMAFPGSHTRQIGNNPLGFGVGVGTSGLSADLCLAYSSLGNLNTLEATGADAPVHWGRNDRGEPTTSAQELLAGAVGPIGGPKGLSLALLGELLTGVLADGPTLDQIATGGGLNTHNQMVLAFDLEAFGGREAVEARVASLKQRAQAMAENQRLPGERSRRASEDGLLNGVLLSRSACSALKIWSQQLGLDVPEAVQQLSE